MARQLRIEYPGAIYHVTCRMLGNAQSRLFKDDADRERFLERLAERVEQYNIRLYLFVLMRNHFHLLFETPEGNCSKFMQSLSTAYTVYYNLRHNRHGHLFDGRYKAKVVEGDDYLLALSRYVHLNPVKVSGIKAKPLEEQLKCLRKYPWSSYRSYVGLSKKLPFVEYSPVLVEMSGKSKERGKLYRQFVESGLASDDKEFMAILNDSPRSIGSDYFRARIDVVYQNLIEKRDVPEDIAFRHVTEPLKASAVLEILAEVLDVDVAQFSFRSRNSPLRAIAAKYLIKYSGLTQRQVAGILEMGSGSAVSRQLRNYEELVPSNRKWKKITARCDALLSNKKVEINEK